MSVGGSGGKGSGGPKVLDVEVDSAVLGDANFFSSAFATPDAYKPVVRRSTGGLLFRDRTNGDAAKEGASPSQRRKKTPTGKKRPTVLSPAKRAPVRTPPKSRQQAQYTTPRTKQSTSPAVTRSQTAAAAAGERPKRGYKKVLLGGANFEAGVASVLRRIVNGRLRCTKCACAVVRFPGFEWKSDDAHYMHFRNFYPDRDSLLQGATPAPAAAAYCCQCSWTSLGDEMKELHEAKAGLSWVDVSSASA